MAQPIQDPYFDRPDRALLDPRNNPHGKFYMGQSSLLGIPFLGKAIQGSVNTVADIIPGGMEPAEHDEVLRRAQMANQFYNNINARMQLGGSNEQEIIERELMMMDAQSREEMRQILSGSYPMTSRYLKEQFAAPMSGLEPTGKTPATRETRENQQGVTKGAIGGDPGSLASQGGAAPATPGPAATPYGRANTAQDIGARQQWEQKQQLGRLAEIPPSERTPEQTANLTGGPVQGAMTDAQRAVYDQNRADEMAKARFWYDGETITTVTEEQLRQYAAEGKEGFALTPNVTATSVGDVGKKPFDTSGALTRASETIQNVSVARAALKEFDDHIKVNPKAVIGTLAVLNKLVVDTGVQFGVDLGNPEAGGRKQTAEGFRLTFKRLFMHMMDTEGRGKWTDQMAEDAIGVSGLLANPNNWATTHEGLSKILDAVETTVRREAFAEGGLMPDPMQGRTPEQQSVYRVARFQLETNQIDDAEFIRLLNEAGIE